MGIGCSMPYPTHEQVYMPALLGRVHRLVFSSSINGLSLPHLKSPLLVPGFSLVPWLKTIRHFSSTDDPSGSIKLPSGNSITSRFDNHGRLGDVDKTNISSQTGPQFQSRKMAVETNRGAIQSEDSFLDKFKLGFDYKRANSSEVEGSSKFEEGKKLSPDQPALESIPQDADEIFKKMKETGLIPNAVAMLDGLCKDGLVQEAMKLFGLMREKGTIPEVVIYTAVVEGYTKAHKDEDAKRIFRKMQYDGISPNAFSYTVLIQGLYKCNRLQDAVEFCMEMLEAGHSPNVTTFVGLVDSICREKGVAEAQGVIRTLIEKGLNVNEKAVREYLDKKAPFSSSVWEAIFEKKAPQRPF